MIGPFRGGRTVAASGIAGQPNVFYIGVNNGGVWKTHRLRPTSGSPSSTTSRPVPSARWPSRRRIPEVIYVGSGEGLQRPDLSIGDGVYKSTDGGKTWTALGLRDGQQISAIVVDPRDPDRVFVAVLGHPYGPNAERGLYRSTDGGKTLEKVLYKDENTGAHRRRVRSRRIPKTVYAVLWAARQGPWENGAWQGPGSGLFKSTDGGDTWQPLTKGLPTIARRGWAASASASRRAIRNGCMPWWMPTEPAASTAPTMRANLARIVDDEPRGSGAAAATSPRSRWTRRIPDIVYVANTSLYRSTDGGKTFTCIKGAPGGDDYHTIWINPDNRDIILLATDQGAIVTVNGGETWSSWYNQPTAQFYHVITDNRVPLLGLWRPAGERLGGRGQPRR